jgi:hypothetical protein
LKTSWKEKKKKRGKKKGKKKEKKKKRNARGISKKRNGDFRVAEGKDEGKQSLSRKRHARHSFIRSMSAIPTCSLQSSSC